MHGVGSVWVKEAFNLFGHDPFTPVISQNDPDPEFKTVSFPNPEENGVRLLYLFFIFVER
jgi:phosphomannomutase